MSDGDGLAGGGSLGAGSEGGVSDGGGSEGGGVGSLGGGAGSEAGGVSAGGASSARTESASEKLTAPNTSTPSIAPTIQRAPFLPVIVICSINQPVNLLCIPSRKPPSTLLRTSRLKKTSGEGGSQNQMWQGPILQKTKTR